jgi:hypothetical protein
MAIKNKLVGVALAAAIALSLKGCATSGPYGTPNNPVLQVNPPVNNQILCYGVNSCRGQSACKLATTTCGAVNKCAGLNACKGQGGVYMYAKDCQAQGGVVPEVPLDSY